MYLQDDVVVLLLGSSVLIEERVNDVDVDVDDGPDEVSKQVVGSLSGDKFSNLWVFWYYFFNEDNIIFRFRHDDYLYQTLDQQEVNFPSKIYLRVNILI